MKYEEFNLSKNADGLLPVVVQDCETLKVLMVAYMNKEAYEKTCQTGKATFFSRTRGALWTKGETSGNFIEVVSMYPDCDNDTLLLMGRPVGPNAQMPEGSYTTHLFTKGVNKIAQKVGEEAVETVIEAIDGNRERYLYEASDLIYHLLVLNEQMGFTIADMEAELASRHK